MEGRLLGLTPSPESYKFTPQTRPATPCKNCTSLPYLRPQKWPEPRDKTAQTPEPDGRIDHPFNSGPANTNTPANYNERLEPSSLNRAITSRGGYGGSYVAQWTPPACGVP